MESSSFSGSSKRAKALGSVGQVAHCLVDGCSADLSVCRDYHRRHKVCEAHSKTPRVTIGGREQRFCQQCSRFHSLVEFDEGKRSCRKRLDGHNRRRRKPQPDSLPRNTCLDFSTQQPISATRLVSFSAPHILASSALGYSWSGVVKPGHEMLNYSSYKGVNQQLQFVQGSDGASMCQPFLHPNGSSSSCSQKMFCDDSGLNQVVDSDGALSLLSSASPASREFGLSHHVVQTKQSREVALAQTKQLPLVNNMDFSGVEQYHLAHQGKPVDSSTGSPAASAATFHFPEMFQHAPEGSSTTGSHQTLSFMWE